MSEKINEMFEAGVQFGYSKSRRHPSTVPYIHGTKTRGDIIDLEKTSVLLEEAKDFMKGLAASGKMVLFVGTKAESRNAMRNAADRLGMPYIDSRWIGGTLTNFKEIRRRVDHLMDLQYKREHNELIYKTKKEKLMIEREITKLEKNFGGLALMKSLPAAVFVIDSGFDSIAIDEAECVKIPTISLSNTDCNIDRITYPIVGNDASIKSIAYIVRDIASAYENGKN